MGHLARLVAVVGAVAAGAPARSAAGVDPHAVARPQPGVDRGAPATPDGLGWCRPPAAPPAVSVWYRSTDDGAADGLGIPPPEACVRWPPGTALDVLVAEDAASLALAACVVGHARRFSPSLLRPALARLEHAAHGASLLDIADVLGGDGSEPACLDETTRAFAALAIGSIVGRRRAVEPRWVVPPVVLARLEDCITLTSTPRRARQACVRAVVAGGIVELIPALERELASCAGADRFAVALALGRLTSTAPPAPGRWR